MIQSSFRRFLANGEVVWWAFAARSLRGPGVGYGHKDNWVPALFENQRLHIFGNFEILDVASVCMDTNSYTYILSIHAKDVLCIASEDQSWWSKSDFQ